MLADFFGLFTASGVKYLSRLMSNCSCSDLTSAFSRVCCIGDFKLGKID